MSWGCDSQQPESSGPSLPPLAGPSTQAHTLGVWLLFEEDAMGSFGQCL